MKKRNILLTTITLLSLAYSSLNAQELSQKEKSISLLEKAFSTNQDRSGLAYINEKKYIQHNLYAQDGIAGLKGYLDYLKGKELENKVLIAFEDDNHVITLSLSSQEKQLSKVIDIFRFEKGFIDVLFYPFVAFFPCFLIIRTCTSTIVFNDSCWNVFIATSF